jgi:hypothetical protein
MTPQFFGQSQAQVTRLYFGRFSCVHIGGLPSNQTASLETQLIPMTPEDLTLRLKILTCMLPRGAPCQTVGVAVAPLTGACAALLTAPKHWPNVALDIWTTLKKRCPHAHSRNNSKQLSKSTKITRQLRDEAYFLYT